MILKIGRKKDDFVKFCLCLFCVCVCMLCCLFFLGTDFFKYIILPFLLVPKPGRVQFVHVKQPNFVVLFFDVLMCQRQNKPQIL
jgi:hypothetical protein